MNKSCEICKTSDELSEIESFLGDEERLEICSNCQSLYTLNGLKNPHWKILSESMWSEKSSVKIFTYKVLNLISEPWSNELASQIYLNDAEQVKANDAIIHFKENIPVSSFDSNGVELLAGDSVTLIKDLVVKGANFTAKRGTLVKNISLSDNAEHIEGRVNGTRIVLVTKFLKKVN